MTPDEQAALVKRTAKLMGELLIARRDAKAVEGNGGWFPVREPCQNHEPRKRCPTCNDMPTLPFTLKDFHDHLLGERCLGTYLLDTDDNVKFFAVDIDLKPDGAQWWPIQDEIWDESLSDAQLGEKITCGELSLETETGNLEVALHDPGHTGHRWARFLLVDRIEVVHDAVEKVLGLRPLCVITGGGGHVIVPLGSLTPARDARAMATEVMERTAMTNIKGDSTFWGTEGNPSYECEVFPKQDTLSKSGQSFGNLIRLPLGWHRAARMRTFFMDPTQREGLRPWEIRKANSIKTLEAAAAAVGVGV